MAELTVPDVFPPDDPVALFCVSMAMAANDVEDASRPLTPIPTVPATTTEIDTASPSGCVSPTVISSRASTP
ncbi:MAG TPA: hypothetical protein VLK37_08310 [Solirubrobacterales bacterium]|nr:hypothetical protein [Solirubrobacterales bacterium]